MDEDTRRETIADVLRPVLHDGEAYQFVCQDGEVWVTNVEASPYALKYPRLYGRLLSLSATLNNSIGRIPNLTMMAAATFCVGLHLHWWDDLLGQATVTKIRSAWFYVLLFFIVMGLLHQLASYLQWRGYCRRREEIFQLMKMEDLDRDTLVAQLEGDGGVARVTTFLKVDPEAEARFAEFPVIVEER